MKAKVDLTELDFKDAPFPCFVPDPVTENLFSDAMAYLVFRWQLFSQLIYSGMQMRFTRFVPIAATDGWSIYLHPEGFEQAEITEIPEIAFVYAHEVCHRIFNDMVMGQAWAK